MLLCKKERPQLTATRISRTRIVFSQSKFESTVHAEVAACQKTKMKALIALYIKIYSPFRTLRAILSATESASRRSSPQKEIDTMPAPT